MTTYLEGDTMEYLDTMRDAGRSLSGQHLGVRTHTVPRPVCPECGARTPAIRTRPEPAARGETMIVTSCLGCGYMISAEYDV